MYVLQTHGSRTEPAAQGRGASRDWWRVRGASRFVSRRIEPDAADVSCACQLGQVGQAVDAAESRNASEQCPEAASARHDEQSRTCSSCRRFAADDRSGRVWLPVSHGYEAKDSRGTRAATVIGGRSFPRRRPRLTARLDPRLKWRTALACDAGVLVETQSPWPVRVHVPLLATCSSEHRVHGAGKAR